MNDERDDLYQDIILDHNRRPRNFRPIDEPSVQIEADNPLCGDQLDLYLVIEGDRIVDASFQGQGCAISMASASLLTEHVKGMHLDEAKRLFEAVHSALTEAPTEEAEQELGDLAALVGVRRYPMRVKCATLSWHALNAALRGEADRAVTSE